MFINNPMQIKVSVNEFEKVLTEAYYQKLTIIKAVRVGTVPLKCYDVHLEKMKTNLKIRNF